MRILIATDVFPPRCGGSGWSAYYLARGGRRLAAVSTVRDYWPLCLYSTGQVPGRDGAIPHDEPCAECWRTTSLLRCLWAAQGAASMRVWPGLPLRQALTARRRRALA